MLKPLLMVVFVAGCSDAAPKLEAKAAERQARAEAALSKAPVPRTYAVGANQLQVIDVPVSDGQKFVDTQRCFIYRDQEFKSSSISCGQQPDVLVTAP